MQKQTNQFDAIVVGSGMSGGWAAKELSEKGLKTLILERGRKVEHIKDYPEANKAPWDYEYRGRVTEETRKEYPIQSKKYSFDESTKDFFASDAENPYTTPDDPEKEVWYYRGFQTGGKSLLWARQSYRFSDIDFEANLKDGHGVDWPIRYKDMAPWYSYVEKFAGISGEALELPQLPDSEFLPPMEMNAVEKHFRQAIKDKLDRVMTIGRTTNLSVRHNGRGPCQYRNQCDRGCPYGAYFTSVSTTIPAALATGNATIKNHAIVHSVIYDKETGKATGVRVMDAETMETTEYFAKVIFLCAGALSTTRIMLMSTSDEFPDGIANTSGALGHYLMDHHSYGFSAEVDGFADKYYNGHRPTGIYIPRFQNLNGQENDFVRGYGYQGGASRLGWSRGNGMKGFGADFKDELLKPGPWRMGIGAFGEILPYYDNHAKLDDTVVDKWGMPVLHISGGVKENERKMQKHMAESATEMFEAAGFKNIRIGNPNSYRLGHKSHEMGTARMGRDPKTSVLNKWNQAHDVPNLFVTDGAAMASAACQNPSLTYMAMSARAADYAVSQLKRGEL